MPIQIFAHHIEVTEEIRLLATYKAERLRRIFDGISTIHLTLEAEKERRVAEIVTNVSHGAPIVARSSAADLREAIDLTFDKIEAQLRKHKDKVRDHRAREHGETKPVPPTEEETAGKADAGLDTE